MKLIKKWAILPIIAVLFMIMTAGISDKTGSCLTVTKLVASELHAQEIQKPDKTASTEKKQEANPASTLYQVMGVVLFIWLGLAFFLFRLDRKVTKLERHVKNLK